MHKVSIKDFLIGQGEPLTLFCGPCVIESEEHALKCAEALKKMMKGRNIQLIFKASYDKANRSSYRSFRGPGMEEGLRILEKVRQEFDLPIVTDVHSVEEASIVGKTVDCIQIPAFLCRQTDLIVAAAQTGTAVSVKKGQFMAPLDMKNVVDKIHSTGNKKVILIERGASFGYNNLVCDMRSIPMMQSLGVPVCFDATHAVMFPGGKGDVSGGDSQYILPLAKAALAAGANCLFIEAHPDPKNALSDKDAVMDMQELAKNLDLFEQLYALVN